MGLGAWVCFWGRAKGFTGHLVLGGFVQYFNNFQQGCRQGIKNKPVLVFDATFGGDED